MIDIQHCNAENSAANTSMKKITAFFCIVTVSVMLTACSIRENYTHSSENVNVDSDNSSLTAYYSETVSETDPEISTTENSTAKNSAADKPPLPEESEEIISLLAKYADFYWNMFPINGPPDELIDYSQSLSSMEGEFSRIFFRVVSGDVQSEAQFIEKLDSLLTQRLKNELLDDPERLFQFSDGGLYITDVGAGGWGLGMDCLLLDSVEYTDENEIIVTVTSFGDKDNWDTSKDITDTCLGNHCKNLRRISH